MRQALAGMLWTKQFYFYDGDDGWRSTARDPLHAGMPRVPRNRDWFHMVNEDIISMPDKWEYPWYAAWDLAFQRCRSSMVDPDFAKEQLELMLRERYSTPAARSRPTSGTSAT